MYLDAVDPSIMTDAKYILEDGVVQTPTPYEPTQNRIVCSAVRYDDGYVLASIRHVDSVCHAFLLKFPQYQKKKPEQGFLDKFGVFHDRHSAWKIAHDAHQIIRRCGGDHLKLWSENLY